jgi:hypothetical protein
MPANLNSDRDDATAEVGSQQAEIDQAREKGAGAFRGALA